MPNSSYQKSLDRFFANYNSPAKQNYGFNIYLLHALKKSNLLMGLELKQFIKDNAFLFEKVSFRDHFSVQKSLAAAIDSFMKTIDRKGILKYSPEKIAETDEIKVILKKLSKQNYYAETGSAYALFFDSDLLSDKNEIDLELDKNDDTFIVGSAFHVENEGYAFFSNLMKNNITEIIAVGNFKSFYPYFADEKSYINDADQEVKILDIKSKKIPGDKPESGYQMHTFICRDVSTKIEKKINVCHLSHKVDKLAVLSGSALKTLKDLQIENIKQGKKVLIHGSASSASLKTELIALIQKEEFLSSVSEKDLAEIFNSIVSEEVAENVNRFVTSLRKTRADIVLKPEVFYSLSQYQKLEPLKVDDQDRGQEYADVVIADDGSLSLSSGPKSSSNQVNSTNSNRSSQSQSKSASSEVKKSSELLATTVVHPDYDEKLQPQEIKNLLKISKGQSIPRTTKSLENLTKAVVEDYGSAQENVKNAKPSMTLEPSVTIKLPEHVDDDYIGSAQENKNGFKPVEQEPNQNVSSSWSSMFWSSAKSATKYIPFSGANGPGNKK